MDVDDTHDDLGDDLGADLDTELAQLLWDEELAELAMAADPDAPLDDDAVPFDTGGGSGLLPDWYMPVPQGRIRTGHQRVVAALVIVSLLALNALGLCVTYGSVEVAW